jgi:hypothetical protein
VNIQNPFASVDCVMEGGEMICNGGLVNMPNSWAARDPRLPEFNVVPGDPDASFLLMKLSGELPSNGDGGEPMPLQVEWETKDADIALLEDWISAGATNGSFASDQGTRNFDPDITNIFGTQEGRSYTGGKCLFCHYEDTPNPPNLNAPFSPVDGVVNVRASYRADSFRVVPGNPEDSFLIQKVKAERATAELGAQMPYSYGALTTTELETVRQWILEGALP